MKKFNDFINKPEEQDELDEGAVPKNLQRLLLLGMEDRNDLELMRRAIRTGEKGLMVPRLRKKLYKLLTIFMDAVEDDNEIFRRLRNRVQKGETK
jgi:hypothetical protein|tara:strand:- start:23615 stop:23899 length:285 start_codon:yes stop_codon:yes gene_type:complete